MLTRWAGWFEWVALGRFSWEIRRLRVIRLKCECEGGVNAWGRLFGLRFFLCIFDFLANLFEYLESFGTFLKICFLFRKLILNKALNLILDLNYLELVVVGVDLVELSGLVDKKTPIPVGTEASLVELDARFLLIFVNEWVFCYQLLFAMSKLTFISISATTLRDPVFAHLSFVEGEIFLKNIIFLSLKLGVQLFILKGVCRLIALIGLLLPY